MVRAAQGVGLRVLNTGDRRVSLAAQVTLLTEQGTAPGTQPNTAGQELTLQTNCERTSCVNLIPGAEVDAPLWLEQHVNARCGALLVPPRPGIYQLRVRACTGEQYKQVDFAWPLQ